jgi:hypothetical protein
MRQNFCPWQAHQALSNIYDLPMKGNTGDRIHNTSFSSQLTNGLKKLECYITLGWKGLQGIGSDISVKSLKRKT